jgi:3-deoxy-7-phosphoheptulonate synthase
MVIVMAADASIADIEHVVSVVHEAGGEASVSRGGATPIIGLSGDVDRFAATLNLTGLPGVANVVATSAPYRLVSREHRQERSVVRVRCCAAGRSSPGLRRTRSRGSARSG